MPHLSQRANRLGSIIIVTIIALALRMAVAGATEQIPSATSPAASTADDYRIDFTTETLPNGLRVIYAPLHQAPVVQVRVLYHVGSRDERPDRQGFAHMFEHMMFRGSKHVMAQEHMRLIDQVGGICNAFTSFDQTVYHDTVPSEDLEMALYLEADRMSSFKVTDQIYQIERKVVAQEWMLKQNRVNGNLYDDLFRTAFTTSSYQWTPMGNMQQLLAAPVSELQEFFNTYYVPNNAVLVIAGDVDVPTARAMVQKYFAWIPAGAPVPRVSPQEPPQLAARAVNAPDHLARLTTVVLGYHIPPYKSDDNYALSVLATMLGGGPSSRLERALVNSKDPICQSASMLDETLEYGGMIGVVGEVKPGKNPEQVKTTLAALVADVLANGVTADELARAKIASRIESIQERETCAQIAGEIGDAELWANDPNRVNSDLAKLDAVTSADVQAVARTYLNPNQVTLLTVEPDPLGTLSRKSSQAARELFQGAAVVASTQPVAARDVVFPTGYPQHPPLPPVKSTASFAKGQETTINGIHLIVLTDSRLPMVNWTLAMRHGSHGESADKAGLAGLTARMLSRGTANHSFQQLSDELMSHGIDLGVEDAGDSTDLSGSCTTEELDRAFSLSREILRMPTFPADEFAKIRDQTQAGLVQSLAVPSTAGERAMTTELFEGSPMGHLVTPSTLAGITLDDIKNFYAEFYHPDDAVMVVSGDVTFERAQQLVKGLTDDWQPKDVPPPEYKFPPTATSRKIVLIDTGDTSPGAGSIVRMGIKSYDIHSDEKYAGTLASVLLSDGIESRLMEYVRAKKGYVYGASAVFQPNRYTGAFAVNAPTRPAVTGDCITAIFKVLDDLKSSDSENPLTEAELNAAKRRVSGSLVMGMQTIASQAQKRLDGTLNGYPVDYYDQLAAHINAVTVDQVRAVMNKYVKDDAMAIIVVAPASTVKDQLDALGDVTLMPMPLAAENASTKNSDMLK